MIKIGIAGLLAAVFLVCSQQSASAQQSPGDFTGQPATGYLLVRPYQCYSDTDIFGAGTPLNANGQCAAGSTAGFGAIDNASTKVVNAIQVTPDIAPQLSVQFSGYTSTAQTFTNYYLNLPVSDFATASSVSAETTRAESAEAALSASITNETNRAIAAENGLRADMWRLSQQFKAATAASVALGGNGFIPGKKLNLTLNVGAYEGQYALSVQGAYVVNPSAFINMGLATGTNGGGAAVRTGVTMGW